MKTETDFPENITIGDKYGPAMKITDQDEANIYFEKCVRHQMWFNKSRDEAVSIEKQNLGYFSGYYDSETMERVQKLFNCSHPVFGKVTAGNPPTPEEAFNAGVKIGKKK
ncbi:MAG: hypothetical protein AABY32_00955 [Nanoarchaeota archaeon]